MVAAILIVFAFTKHGVYVRQHVSAPLASKNNVQKLLCEDSSSIQNFGEQSVSDNGELLNSINITNSTLQLPGGATPISKCPDVCVRDLKMDPF